MDYNNCKMYFVYLFLNIIDGYVPINLKTEPRHVILKIEKIFMLPSKIIRCFFLRI